MSCEWVLCLQKERRLVALISLESVTNDGSDVPLFTPISAVAFVDESIHAASCRTVRRRADGRFCDPWPLFPPLRLHVGAEAVQKDGPHPFWCWYCAMKTDK